MGDRSDTSTLMLVVNNYGSRIYNVIMRFLHVYNYCDGKPCEGIEQGRFNDCSNWFRALMPDAENVDVFWQNIIDSKVNVVEIEEQRWPGKIEHFWRNGGPGDTKKVSILRWEPS